MTPPEDRLRPGTRAERDADGDGTARSAVATIDGTADETGDRPLCRVVNHYCEALRWLRREPGPAARCCRHYWGDEAVAGRG